MSFKVAILIPSTTKERPWKNIEETDLYKISLKSFLLTYDKEHRYTYYIGIDDNDTIYSKDTEQKKLHRFVSVMKNVSLQFISMKDITKGHLTAMWNRLFHKAYHDDCDYFYQCGDDIQFLNKGWVSKSIKLLQLYHNLGCTGPQDKMQSRIHTQSFVSRKHYEIFKFYFPPEIINWFCDDWMTKVYWEDLLYPLLDKWCMNCGGAPRYTCPRFTGKYTKQRRLCNKLIRRDRKRLSYTLKHSGLVFPTKLMSQIKAEMIKGYNENEKKLRPTITKTFNKVMASVNDQYKSHKTQMGQLIGASTINNKLHNLLPPSKLNAKKKIDMTILPKD